VPRQVITASRRPAQDRRR